MMCSCENERPGVYQSLCVNGNKLTCMSCHRELGPTAYAATPAKGTDPGFVEVHGELLDLHVRKSSTYGNDGERFHNFTSIAEVTGQAPERYAWERILEKAIRALNQIEAGDADSVKEGPDVAGLACICEALKRRRL